MIGELNLEGTDGYGIDWREQPPAEVLDGFSVLVIGAGMSGICAAYRLKEAGIPYTVVEKNPTVGGTWYENSYPGCKVDVPNHFYSYSFETQTDWPQYYSNRDQLHDYFERCVDNFRSFLADLRRPVRRAGGRPRLGAPRAGHERHQRHAAGAVHCPHHRSSGR